MLRFEIGDYVRMKRLHSSCTSLKVVKIQETLESTYTLELEKSCGEKVLVRTPWGVETRYEYEAGVLIRVRGDDPSELMPHVKVELRKCRVGAVEQEFVVIPEEASGNDDVMNGDGSGSAGTFIIRHAATGFLLSTAMGAAKESFYVHGVFEKGLFDKSEEYFFIKTHNAMGEDSFVISGSFGETEFSEALLLPTAQDPNAEQNPFSMWSFRKFVNDPSVLMQRESVVDEHASWLEKMTQNIGIEYLQELAPWHLLDVEREASKNEVKSRFRELSRYFHPDKVLSEKKELFEKIFIMLQNAYDGLKITNERQKERFRKSADIDSQLFSHSRHVVELLPFHWAKVEEGSDSDVRFVINATSHLNSINATDSLTEQNVVEQLWVIFLYSARCSMSRTVVGFIDLAAGHLKKYENIKVGAYGCGLYADAPASNHDLLGVTTDPICKQFQRRETPNVHVVVETISGSDAALNENSKFKYFYSSVPYGNATEFFPHNFIRFAIHGKRIWNDQHLVKKMTARDFSDQAFIQNFSVVAFVDGTKYNQEALNDEEVQDAIVHTLPGIARRFSKANVYVGIAACGWDGNDDDDRLVDCSMLGVSWLPDVKLYGMNATSGISLLRGQFGDRRDVQIAVESMGNTLSMIIGQSDDDLIDDFEELKSDEEDPSILDQPSSPTNQCQDPFAHDKASLDSKNQVGLEHREITPNDTDGHKVFGELDSHQENETQNARPHVTGAADEQTSSNPRLSHHGQESSKGSNSRPKLAHGTGESSYASRKPLNRSGHGKILGEGVGNGGSVGGAIGSR